MIRTSGVVPPIRSVRDIARFAGGRRRSDRSLRQGAADQRTQRLGDRAQALPPSNLPSQLPDEAVTVGLRLGFAIADVVRHG